ncbi:MAG: hypothetical protein ACJ8FY_22720 [Gemmataceae bacterium]
MKRFLPVLAFLWFCLPCQAADELKPYDLKKGDVGVFKSERTGSGTGQRLECHFNVSRILGDNEMILREEGLEEQLNPAIARIATPGTPKAAFFRTVYVVGKPFAIIKGISTDGLVDGSKVELKGGFKVTGTRTIGSTYFVVEPLAGKEKQAFEDAEKQAEQEKKDRAKRDEEEEHQKIEKARKEKERKEKDPNEILKRERAEKAIRVQAQNDEAESLLRRAKFSLNSAKELASVPKSQDRIDKFKNKARELLESLLRLYPESPSGKEAKDLLAALEKG